MSVRSVAIAVAWYRDPGRHANVVTLILLSAPVQLNLPEIRA